MTLRIKTLATLIILVLASTAALAEGDAEKGEKVFKKCKTCHFVDKEKNKIGPHLVGIMGRTSGAVEGFKYSKPMMEAGITWDEETIAAYLADPKGYIKGNKMAFPGLKKDNQIADVIAYIKEATGG